MADNGDSGFPKSLGLLILRVGAGGFLATHGWGKVQQVVAGDFQSFPDPIGLGSGLSLVLAAGAEFVCALLVAVGCATRIAALPPAFAMGVAAFVAHASDPWTMQPGGGGSKEPALLFLSAFAAIALLGAGRFSADAWLISRRESQKKAKDMKKV
jgi:putative oxidoreductase